MAAKTQAAAPARRDDRIHGTVYCRSDPRADDIVRRHKKSEIIALPDVDCCMLFRVEAAHMGFDMFQNYRPFIQFDGMAEGVFLPRKTGLLFPNACDQLDFRQDYPVPASMEYALSDTEIAVLAGNGLFNGDWSCQGRVIGSVLEIPCKIDYFAVAYTPITFIDIQERLGIRTSTMQTGYKTLAAAFLPYSAQKHNLEQRAERASAGKLRFNDADINKRAGMDPPAVGFGAGDPAEIVAGGASFVEVAQSRIKKRLQGAMAEGDVLGTSKARQDPGAGAGTAASEIAESLASIRARQEEERSRIAGSAADIGQSAKASEIDATLAALESRMIYAGAGEIPVQVPPVQAEPLVGRPAAGEAPAAMERPVVPDPDKPSAERSLDDLDDRVRHGVLDAKGTAEDIAAGIKDVKNLPRAQRLAAKRAQQAGKAKAAVAGATETAAAAVARKPSPNDGDIMSGDVDLDEIMRSMGG